MVPRFDVVTIFPDMVAGAFRAGVAGRALAAGLVRLETWNPRDFAEEPRHGVDDRPYGGGPGMVMKFAPLAAAVRAACAARADAAPVLYLSPQGERFDDGFAHSLSEGPGAVLVCGRYEGVDERFIESCVDRELSIGDYVLSGGEPAAVVVLDAIVRLVPGALGDAASAVEDSFVEGFLDYPHYTRPEEIEGRKVPEVLLSGDHAAIRRWRRSEAEKRTRDRRGDLLSGIQRSRGGQQA